MDGRSKNKGTIGNRGGRRYKETTLDAFWSALDKQLPYVIQSVSDVMAWADQQLADPDRSESALGLQKLKIDAAKVLISKAPDRVASGTGGDLFTSLLDRVLGKKE